MSKITGRLVSIGVAREITRGVGIAPAMWIPQMDFSLVEKVDRVRDSSGFGNIADSQDVLVTEKYSEGEISGVLRDQTFGYFLLAMLGTVASSVSGAGYSHAFTLAQNNQHPSLSIVKKDLISTVMYKMSMLDKLNIKVSLDSLITFTAGMMAKGGDVYTSATPSYTNTNKFTKKHTNVKVAADVSSLAAASPLEIKTLELNIEKNLVRDSAFGTVQPIDILNKSITVSGTMSLNMEDTTFRDYMIAGTKKSMQIILSNTDVDLGGALHPSLTITLPSVDFEWTPNYALEDIVSQTIAFKGNYDLANGLQIISACTLVNAKISY